MVLCFSKESLWQPWLRQSCNERASHTYVGDLLYGASIVEEISFLYGARQWPGSAAVGAAALAAKRRKVVTFFNKKLTKKKEAKNIFSWHPCKI